MTTRKTGFVEKGWGSELIWATNDKYAGKLLRFKKDAQFVLRKNKNTKTQNKCFFIFQFGREFLKHFHREWSIVFYRHRSSKCFQWSWCIQRVGNFYWIHCCT